MTNTRRARVKIEYMGVDISQDIAPYLISFSYKDNEGKSDEISFELEDRDRKWQGPWIPEEADLVKASIVLLNWHKEGDKRTLHCGTFFVDDVGFKGPPDTISIKALSVPFKKGGKNTKVTRSWEKVTLRKALEDVAASIGLTLLYDAEDYYYERLEQNRQTGLVFAKEAAKREGLAIKVTDEQMVVYDEKMYEAKQSVRTIKRRDSDLKSYDFQKASANKRYKKVQVTYKNGKRWATYTYEVPGVDDGPTLKVKKRANTLTEAMRWAKAEARNKNKTAKTAKLTLMGDDTLIQGVTVNIEGFGAFDGKYYIESSTHDVTGGYSVNISLREVLSY